MHLLSTLELISKVRSIAKHNRYGFVQCISCWYGLVQRITLFFGITVQAAGSVPTLIPDISHDSLSTQ